MKRFALSAIKRFKRGTAMSLHFITIAMSLFVGAFVFGGTLAFTLKQMPTPQMRVRRNALVAHR